MEALRFRSLIYRESSKEQLKAKDEDDK